MNQVRALDMTAFFGLPPLGFLFLFRLILPCTSVAGVYFANTGMA